MEGIAAVIIFAAITLGLYKINKKEACLTCNAKGCGKCQGL